MSQPLIAIVANFSIVLQMYSYADWYKYKHMRKCDRLFAMLDDGLIRSSKILNQYATGGMYKHHGVAKSDMPL